MAAPAAAASSNVLALASNRGQLQATPPLLMPLPFSPHTRTDMESDHEEDEDDEIAAAEEQLQELEAEAEEQLQGLDGLEVVGGQEGEGDEDEDEDGLELGDGAGTPDLEVHWGWLGGRLHNGMMWAAGGWRRTTRRGGPGRCAEGGEVGVWESGTDWNGACWVKSAAGGELLPPQCVPCARLLLSRLNSCSLARFIQLLQDDYYEEAEELGVDDDDEAYLDGGWVGPSRQLPVVALFPRNHPAPPTQPPSPAEIILKMN